MCARPPLTPRRSALLRERARHMRHAMTPSEAALWSRLKSGQLGVRFARQQVLGGRYIVDFFSPASRLAVEVDGASHGPRAVADARRDRVLARLGYRVLRIEAELVLRSLPEAVARVVAALAAAP